MCSFLVIYPKSVKLFEDIQRIRQTCDQIVDDTAGTSSITSILHVKTCPKLSSASAAKVVVDQRRESIKTLLTIEADANLSSDVKAEARGLRQNLLSFPILFSIAYAYQLAIMKKLSEKLQTIKFAASTMLYRS